MPFQPASNVVSADFFFTWQGQQVMNKHHYFMDPVDVGDMNTLASELYLWWANHLSQQVSSTVLLREVAITDLTTQDGPTASYTNSPLVGGSNVNESVVNSTSIVVSLKTAGRGRSRRGRIYHVGLTDNVVADNRVSQAALDALLVGYSKLLDPNTISVAQLCVLSRQFNNVVRPVASSATVTSMTFHDNVVDGQRRRLPNRGS